MTQINWKKLVKEHKNFVTDSITEALADIGILSIKATTITPLKVGNNINPYNLAKNWRVSFNYLKKTWLLRVQTNDTSLRVETVKIALIPEGRKPSSYLRIGQWDACGFNIAEVEPNAEWLARQLTQPTFKQILTNGIEEKTKRLLMLRSELDAQAENRIRAREDRRLRYAAEQERILNLTTEGV